MKRPALFLPSLLGEYLLHCYVTNVPGSRTKVVEAIRRGSTICGCVRIRVCVCVWVWNWRKQDLCQEFTAPLPQCEILRGTNRGRGGNPASLAPLLYLGPDNRLCVNSGSFPKTITITGSTMLPLLQLSSVDVWSKAPGVHPSNMYRVTGRLSWLGR